MSARNQTILMVAALALVIAALFARVGNAEFIDLDDPQFVAENPHVLTGLTRQNISWAWTHAYAAYWIPLTWMSYQLDATIAGPPRRPDPPPHHLPDAPGPLPNGAFVHRHNIVYQVLAATFLFLFLTQLLGSRWLAWTITLLWAIHPLRVESVAWATERKDVLAGMFGFLAMYLYVRYVHATGRRALWYTAVVLAFSCSLMCKVSFITLPFILVLLDVWPLRRVASPRDLGRRFAEKIPLFALTVAFCIIMLMSQRAGGSVAPLSAVPFSDRLLNAPFAYAIYLLNHVRFWHLAVLYPTGFPPPAWVAGICLVLLLAITAFFIQQFRRRPWLLIGWLWFVGAMFPWIGLLQSGPQAYADRFTYLPAVGLFLLVVVTAQEWWQSKPAVRVPLVAAASIAAVYFATFTFQQLGYWHDTLTLMDHSTRVSSNSYILRGLYATGYLRRGLNEQAAEQFEKAVDLNPNFAPAWLSLGGLRFDMGEYPQAILALRKAAQLKPRDPATRELHGLALASAGFLEEAIHEFQVVLYLKPNDQAAARNLQIARRKLEAKRAATTRH
jgi:Flp pilus assembly protein TadD